LKTLGLSIIIIIISNSYNAMWYVQVCFLDVKEGCVFLPVFGL